MIGWRRSRRKYANTPINVDSYKFASKKEGRRYLELRLFEKLGDVRELEVHPRFHLCVGDEHIATYVADFSYKNKTGMLIVEDVKGVKTAVYKLKKRLMKVLLGIEVQEV